MSLQRVSGHPLALPGSVLSLRLSLLFESLRSQQVGRFITMVSPIVGTFLSFRDATDMAWHDKNYAQRRLQIPAEHPTFVLPLRGGALTIPDGLLVRRGVPHRR